jgi:hypothetical protein
MRFDVFGIVGADDVTSVVVIVSVATHTKRFIAEHPVILTVSSGGKSILSLFEESCH